MDCGVYVGRWGLCKFFLDSFFFFSERVIKVIS